MRTLGGLHELEERVFGMMGHERMKQLLDAVALFNTVFEKEVDNERQNEGIFCICHPVGAGLRPLGRLHHRRRIFLSARASVISALPPSRSATL